MSDIPLLSSSQNENSPVYLNVYGCPINYFLRRLGFSFCLSSVQVLGGESIFRPSGIIVGGEFNQIQCLKGQYRLDSILIGYTQLDCMGVALLITDLQKLYINTAASYHPLTNNCHHFADRFCGELTGNNLMAPIPHWLHPPGKIGLCCKYLIPCNCLIPDDLYQPDEDEFNAEITEEDHTDGSVPDRDGGDFGDATAGREQLSPSGL